MAAITEWAKQLDVVYAGKKPLCPRCNAILNCTVFMGINRIGYATIRCDACHESVTLSRIKVPESYNDAAPM